MLDTALWAKVTKGINGLKSMIGDARTRVLVVMASEHHEIHEEDHFYLKTFAESVGGLGSITEFIFTTPVGPKRMHAKMLLIPDSDFQIELFRGATYSAPGIEMDTFNNDHDSTNEAETKAYVFPVITDDGQLVWNARSGGGKNPIGVAPALNYEIICATDTTYLFRLTKKITQAAIVDVDFWWYEHTDEEV